MKRETILLLIVLWGSGCSSSQAPLQHYTLNTPVIKAETNSRFGSKTLKVMHPRSLKEKISQKMYYSYSASERGTYLNSQWSNSVGRLLEGMLIDTLDKSRQFRAVLPYASTLKEDYRLESSIFTFEHRVKGSESHALVSIQFSLIDRDAGKLIKNKRFSYKIPTETTDAEGYAEATNRAVSRLVKDLLVWLIT